jgi:hypothetical protein
MPPTASIPTIVTSSQTAGCHSGQPKTLWQCHACFLPSPGQFEVGKAIGRGHTILTSRELMWCWRVELRCERRFNIEFYGADSHFCHSAYVTWSRVELWSAHVPARLSNFCCGTHFVRRDVRVERSSDVTSCFQKCRKCLLEKCANGPFYMTPSQ